MKIALVVPGGVDRSGTHRVIPCLLWLIERLARAHEVHVFALRQEPRPSRYPLLGAEVHNCGGRPRRLRAVAAMLAEHRRSPFDALHAVWGPGPGVVAAAVGRVVRRPVLTHLTGGDLASIPDIDFGARRRWQGRAWLRLAVAGAARVTVPSHAMQRSAAALGIAAERVPYGVALDRWPPRAPRSRRPDEPARLLHVASLNRVKDQGMLLRAARALRDAGTAFRLDIVGEDTLGGSVQRMATALGLDDVVTFHGFLPHARLRPMVEAADLVLVSSRHEADPIVLLEAAVAGVPTVGTAVGHLADWAPDAAVAVPIGDAAALARETAALLADEPRRMRIAAAAQARALAEDADWTARRINEILEEMRNPGRSFASAVRDTDRACIRRATRPR
ncbi:MAG TPA: glycosyltransferase family 4 protein [Longimicrobiales bacterium]